MLAGETKNHAIAMHIQTQGRAHNFTTVLSMKQEYSMDGDSGLTGVINSRLVYMY